MHGKIDVIGNEELNYETPPVVITIVNNREVPEPSHKSLRKIMSKGSDVFTQLWHKPFHSLNNHNTEAIKVRVCHIRQFSTLKHSTVKYDSTTEMFQNTKNVKCHNSLDIRLRKLTHNINKIGEETTKVMRTNNVNVSDLLKRGTNN